jgi:hypothetical protein
MFVLSSCWVLTDRPLITLVFTLVLTVASHVRVRVRVRRDCDDGANEAENGSNHAIRAKDDKCMLEEELGVGIEQY